MEGILGASPRRQPGRSGNPRMIAEKRAPVRVAGFFGKGLLLA
jgi:hypothetical protein